MELFARSQRRSKSRRKRIKTWLAVSISFWLAACATAPAPQRPERLFHDVAFEPPSERISADRVFALDDEMKHYLSVGIAAELRRKGFRQGLIDALYNGNQLKLKYDTAMTRNASEAFTARSGNCLSLVIMTAALAKHLGLPVQYHSVFTEDTWTRSGDIYFANTHVNLSLRNRLATEQRVSSDDRDETTIDFLPKEDIRGQRWRAISEETIVAMYMNNRAAEMLARGQLTEAYWWARESMLQDPKFLDAFNTLGVIYHRHGDLLEAEMVLRSVLSSEPDNTGALSNLALVLKDEGKLDESRVLAQQLEHIEPFPPFHFFNLGLAALKRSDFLTARDMFRKELKRAAYYHEIHFGLALASYGLGDIRRARDELAEAMEDSTTHADHDLYAAKLAWIKSYRQQ
jgi:Flp pilus assembly protein TadD